MNLLDIVAVKPNAKSKIASAKLASHEKTVEDYTTAIGVINNLKSSTGVNDITGQLLKSLNDCQHNLIQEHFSNTISIPSNLRYSKYELSASHTVSEYDIKDDLVKLTESPRTTLKELIGISKLADMIVIPFDYLSPESYSSETYTIKETMTGFTRATNKHNLDTYVICPLRHYSILKHISSQDPNRQIVANAYQQNFDVLSMMLPALIMCSDRLTKAENKIGDLSVKVSSLDNSMAGVIRGLESMDKQLKSLQDKIEAQRIENIQLKFEQEQIKKIQKEMPRADYKWFMAYEPLMFAVRKGTDLLSDTEDALIGPCWGPDFNDIVAASLEWKKINGQRNKLSSKLTQLWY